MHTCTFKMLESFCLYCRRHIYSALPTARHEITLMRPDPGIVVEQSLETLNESLPRAEAYAASHMNMKFFVDLGPQEVVDSTVFKNN